ncbi:hypothetical protein [Anaerocolumna jejuensis]|uniref:hypothetical protein n=1 Tax=Anaerocolumna jejuensis TaxID=259063 RepID=UPI003F7B5ECB
MIIYGLIIIISVLTIIQKWQNKSLMITNEKFVKPYQYFKWFFIVAPVAAFIIFAILFSTILTGRFNERCSHALIILVLWLYSASFYTQAIFFRERKYNLVFGIAGMSITIGTAILLTPIDRYVTLLNNFIPIGTYILGVIMLSVHYINQFLFGRRSIIQGR